MQIKAYEIPLNWSIEAADFVNKLIRRKPSHRLGYTNGITELKMHPWFANMDWKALELGLIRPPWMPQAGDNFNSKIVDFSEKEERAIQEAELRIRRDSVQELFKSYYYDAQIPQIEEAIPNIRKLDTITKTREKALEQKFELKNSHSRNQSLLLKFKIKKGVEKDNKVQDLWNAKYKKNQLFGSNESGSTNAGSILSSKSSPKSFIALKN